MGIYLNGILNGSVVRIPIREDLVLPEKNDLVVVVQMFDDKNILNNGIVTNICDFTQDGYVEVQITSIYPTIDNKVSDGQVLILIPRNNNELYTKNI